MEKWLDKYKTPKAQNGIEGTMSGLTDIGFNYNGAWGGPSMQTGGQLTFLQPNDPRLPSGIAIPNRPDILSSELATSIGGENGEPAYLVPSFKRGKRVNPVKEFQRTGEYLGGPFKTWQEADEWERTVRHPYVEKGQTIPSPYKWWGKDYEAVEKMQFGGLMKSLVPATAGIFNLIAGDSSKKKENKKTQTYTIPEVIEIKDPRRVRKTTGKEINPNTDLVSGKYDTRLIDETLKAAKSYGLSEDDAWNLAAIGLQETGWGRVDDNIGHIKDGVGIGDTENEFLNAYVNKMREADRLKITDPELRLQVYNGLGVIRPETEQRYHGFKMKKIYGVPVPKEGISMRKNPLYGKQVIDIRDNVLKKNPEVVSYIESLYGKKNIKKEMGGSLPSVTGMFYTREGAPSNGKYAKKTMASAQDGLKESKDWLKKWYEERKELPEFEDIATKRISALEQDVPLKLVPAPKMKKMGAYAYYDPKDVSISAMDPETVSQVVPRIDSNVAISPYVLGHEMIHHLDYTAPQSGKDAPKYPLFSDDISFVKQKESGVPLLEYMWITSPMLRKTKTEANAVLFGLRQAEGLKGNKPTTPEQMQKIIDKYINLKGEDVNPQTKEGLKNYQIRMLINALGKDPKKLSEANNRIVMGSYEKPTTAQNGMEMKYYQDGLDFRPKTISKKGSKIKKDDMGYWNPENWGKPVEIGSNEITMQGLEEIGYNKPLLGISDTGDVQMMYPGEDYTFDGESVTEYPMMQKGGSIPTAADSVHLYNSQMALNKFYQNEMKAGRIKITGSGKFKPYYKRIGLYNLDKLNKQNLDFYREAIKNRGEMSVYGRGGLYDDSYNYYFNLTPNQVKKLELEGLGKTKSGSKYQQYYRDLITPQQNLASPFALIDSRIDPQRIITYEEVKNYRKDNKYKIDYPGGTVEVFDYDPLAIKPYHMRTPQEKIEWEKKYGKPKPKPTVKSEPKKEPVKEPVKEIKKEQPKPVEKKQNIYEGSPVYSPGAGSGSPSALIGFVNKKGDTTFIKPEDYERFAVPKYGREYIEKQKNGGVSVNKADEYPIEKLDQLLNFTNYNKPTKGGWLDKYK